MKLVLIVLISTLAGEKAQAQVSFYSTSGSVNPGPSFCDAERFDFFGLGINNNTNNSITTKQIGTKFNDSLGLLDSFFLFDENRNLLKSIPASKKTFDVSLIVGIGVTKNYQIGVKSKIGKKGQIKIDINNFLYQEVTGYTVDITVLGGPVCEIRDCSPKIKVEVFDNNRRDGKYCDNEKPGAYGNTQNYWVEIKSQKWLLNGKEVWTKNSSNSGFYLPNDLMKLEYPKTKILLEVVDYMGRIGRDSITIDVIKSPQINIITSSESFCSDKKLPVSVDTVGLSSWSINWGKQVGINNNFHISEGGTYYF